MAGTSAAPSYAGRVVRGRPRRSTRRLVVAVVILGAVVLGTGYLVVGAAAYQELSQVVAGCGGRWSGWTPANFEAREDSGNADPRYDASPYHFTDYTDVSFRSRNPALTIRGWWAPPHAQAGGRVVILVHGYNACRKDPVVEIPAGMLHRAGFGVLLFDLRDHGDSDVEDGRWAGGTEEWEDALGAFDWVLAQGYEASRVGLYGASLGASTASIAFGHERRVAALWEDSGPANVPRAAAEYAESKGYPSWVIGSGFLVGWLVSRDTLWADDAEREAANFAGRPLFIVHGTADRTVLVHNAYDLARAAEAAGTHVEPWILEGVGHTQAVYTNHEEYEQKLVEFFTRGLAGS